MTSRIEVAGPYQSLSRAKRALDNMYADGSICEGEKPDIISRVILVKWRGQIQDCRVRQTAYFVTAEGDY